MNAVVLLRFVQRSPRNASPILWLVLALLFGPFVWIIWSIYHQDSSMSCLDDIMPNPPSTPYFMPNPPLIPYSPFHDPPVRRPPPVAASAQAAACPFFRRCRDALIEFNRFVLKEGYLNPEADRCFCNTCCLSRGEMHIAVARGLPPKPYVLPLGFARVGLKVQATPEKARRAFGDGLQNGANGLWHVAFHGTKPEYLGHILKQGHLLAPGTTSVSGVNISVRPGHIDNSFRRLNEHTGKLEEFDPRDKLFLSPSMKYCDYRGVYMTPKQSADGRSYRFALQVRIQPDTYHVGQQTVFPLGTDQRIDDFLPNSSLEWYTNEVQTHILTGIIIGSD